MAQVPGPVLVVTKAHEPPSRASPPSSGILHRTLNSGFEHSYGVDYRTLRRVYWIIAAVSMSLYINIYMCVYIYIYIHIET